MTQLSLLQAEKDRIDASIEEQDELLPMIVGDLVQEINAFVDLKLDRILEAYEKCCDKVSMSTEKCSEIKLKQEHEEIAIDILQMPSPVVELSLGDNIKKTIDGLTEEYKLMNDFMTKRSSETVEAEKKRIAIRKQEIQTRIEEVRQSNTLIYEKLMDKSVALKVKELTAVHQSKMILRNESNLKLQAAKSEKANLVRRQEQLEKEINRVEKVVELRRENPDDYDDFDDSRSFLTQPYYGYGQSHDFRREDYFTQ